MLKISHSLENNNTSHVVANQTEAYIIFTVDHEEIGVEAIKVLELVNYMAPLKMPNNFTNVSGMAIYRGRMIPIIDLRSIFGLEPIVYDDNTVTIIVESGVSAFGITAERVLDLIFVPLTSIKKVSAINFGEKTKYLKSVANLSERLVLLLDVDKIIETKSAQSVLEGPVQPESLTEPNTGTEIAEILNPEPGLIGAENQIVLPEKEESGESSCPRIDPEELEDLINSILPEPEQEKEAAVTKDLNEPELPEDSNTQDDYWTFEGLQLESNVEIEPSEPGGGSGFAEINPGLVDPKELEAILVQLERGKEIGEDQTSIDTDDNDDTDSPKDDILKPEEIAKVLSSLESDGVMDLPEDLFKIETTAEIQLDQDPSEGQSLNEVIEGILKELEAKTETNSKDPSSEGDRKI